MAALSKRSLLHKDSSDDWIARVKNIELRADECLERFALLTVEKDVARWTILSAVIHLMEDNYRRFGPDSSAFRAAMINLARHAPMLIRWLETNGTAAVSSDWLPHWDSFVGARAFSDLKIVANYDAFLHSYPMWYRDRVSAELLSDNIVRFQTHPNSRDRQISAFQKGMRRLTGPHQAVAGERVEPTEAILRRYERILDAAHPRGMRGFSYDNPEELLNRTFRKYLQRTETIMRRSKDLSLGVYTLGTFMRLYAALQSICAIHDFLCFRWGQRTGTYPIESAVLVKARSEWIRLISAVAGIEAAVTEYLLNDMTFDSKRLPDLHVFPIVPLDPEREMLALAPPFILGSSPEDNILRTCSYLRADAYNRLSDNKALVMREDLLEALHNYQCDHSIPLPDGSTDIDLLVEDVQSSTVLIAELKWYRKPCTYRERLRADADFEDGYKRQLSAIQSYCTQHSDWLKDRGRLNHSLCDYDNVFYLLIGRDHWTWFEPTDSTAVVEFEQFRLFVGQHTRLNEAIKAALRYEWLPVEGEDFHVQYDRAIVGEVSLESEVYYGGPAGLPAISR